MSFIIVSSTDWYGPSTTYSAINPLNDEFQPLELVEWETQEQAENARGNLEEGRGYSQEELAHNQSSRTRFLVAEVLDHNVDEPSNWQIVDRCLSFTEEYPEDWEGWEADGEDSLRALNAILEGESKALVFDAYTHNTLLVQY